MNAGNAVAYLKNDRVFMMIQLRNALNAKAMPGGLFTRFPSFLKGAGFIVPIIVIATAV